MLSVTEKLYDAEQDERAGPKRIRLSRSHQSCEAIAAGVAVGIAEKKFQAFLYKFLGELAMTRRRG